MKRTNVNEVVVIYVIIVVGITLSMLLSGCDGSLDVAFKNRRAAAFTECETYCRATPLAVKFDSNGELVECRCDVVFSEVE